ncbi:MAG: hypothetical protein PUG17_06995 [Stecheria intestinalis]|nr:hypothetical protein [Stecheria intestinalis]
MKRIAAKAEQKLRSQEGASLMVALLFFVMCAAVGSMILAAASSSAGRISGLETGSREQEELQLYARYLEHELTGDNAYVSQTPAGQTVSEYSKNSLAISDVLKVLASKQYQSQYKAIQVLGSSYWGTNTGNANIWEAHQAELKKNSQTLTRTYRISRTAASSGLTHDARAVIAMQSDYRTTITVTLLDQTNQPIGGSIVIALTPEYPEIRYDRTLNGDQIYFRVAWSDAELSEGQS